MRLVLWLVWIVIALYVSVNWAASVAESPGGVTALAFLAFVGFLVVGILANFVWLVVSLARRTRRVSSYIYYHPLSDIDKDAVFAKMAADRKRRENPDLFEGIIVDADPEPPKVYEKSIKTDPIRWAD